MKHLCIYHQNCHDGFAAALVVDQYAQEHKLDIEYLPAHYGDAAPDVKDKHIIIVDFSYPREILTKMHADALTLTVLDHHKSAQQQLSGLDYCVFDQDKSGASLTWEFFFGNRQKPQLIDYIEDRDLWRFKLPETKAISAALQTIPMTFDAWRPYLDDDTANALYDTGVGILRYQNAQIDKILRSEIPKKDIAGHLVPCINATHLISELGNELAKGQPFAALYFDTADTRVYSLRSDENGLDVSEIAKQFGGGGHKHAAGFTVSKPYIDLERP